MKKMKRRDLTYYIGEESITLEYHKQYISFNCYALQNRKPFKEFKKTLINSHNREYNNLNDIYGLATRHGIRPTAGHKPTIYNNKIAL